MIVTIELPWPPSVNHYYRHVGPRVLISKDGNAYRDAVSWRIRNAGIKKFLDPVELNIQLYPPDKRRRDVDNVLKSLLDSMTIGGVYADDSQVKKLSIEMLEPMSDKIGGSAVVRISNYVKNSLS